MKSSNVKWWLMWLCGSVLLGAYYASAMQGNNEDVFLPGQTSHGHYQIELACDVCHGEAFDDENVMQKACVSCHKEELERVDDSHPRKKFTDPRNVDRLEKLDARYCVTCHGEHKPDITADMGVTLPKDFCFLCHQEVAKNRPSHEGLPFDGCAAAGCHNYHDNKALYEDFLVKHGNDEATKVGVTLPVRNLAEFLSKTEERDSSPLSMNDADKPTFINVKESLMSEWLASGHAQAGVNCSSCHMAKGVWADRPQQSVCKQCHGTETKGFLAGKHGMRLAQGLSPLTPAAARLPMKQERHDEQMSCQSCHGSHSYNTQYAAVDACLTCHNDEHSLAYKSSPHFELWQKQANAELEEGGGVSCSSCHMPREVTREQGHARVVVHHNQNDFLRPNEKMVRSVCMQCHGLGFSLNALADAHLVENNFKGSPNSNNESIRMAIGRETKKQ